MIALKIGAQVYGSRQASPDIRSGQSNPLSPAPTWIAPPPPLQSVLLLTNPLSFLVEQLAQRGVAPLFYCLRFGTVWSPSGGLWFSEPHFEHDSPAELHETFTRRAERIAKAQIGDWQTSSRENQEASLAAQQVTDS